MGRRRNPACTCNACCPRCGLKYNEPYCSIDWDCASCCGSAYEDNQRYYLVAFNDDNSTYADYGDVGKNGRIVAVRGKRYRLTVTGPDCLLDRAYYASVPAGPCRDCAPDCTPNPPYTTHSITGIIDNPGIVTLNNIGSGYLWGRDSWLLSQLNHTKTYPVEVDLRFGPGSCPWAYTLGEKYFIDTISTRSEIIEDYGAPWQGPLKTADSVWDVYGYWEFTSPTINPYYRMSFVLQSYNEVSYFHPSGTRYVRAPLVPPRGVVFAPATGSSGARIFTWHAPPLGSSYTGFPWCYTNPQTIFFQGSPVSFGPAAALQWIGGTL